MSSSKRFWVVMGILACIAAAIYSRSAVSTGAPEPRGTTRIALFAAHADPFWDIVIAGAKRRRRTMQFSMSSCRSKKKGLPAKQAL